MDFLKDPAFWWAVFASVWAVLSDYLGSNPNVKSNGVSQLVIRMISSAVRGEAQSAGRVRRRRR
jgi:hypothetical protein